MIECPGCGTMYITESDLLPDPFEMNCEKCKMKLVFAEQELREYCDMGPGVPEEKPKPPEPPPFPEGEFIKE